MDTSLMEICNVALLYWAQVHDLHSINYSHLVTAEFRDLCNLIQVMCHRICCGCLYSYHSISKKENPLCSVDSR